MYRLYRALVIVAAAAGFGGWLLARRLRLAGRRRTPAQQFARTLERLGTTFVKLGQGLSLHRHLLPDTWVAEEARAVQRFAAAFAGSTTIHVPPIVDGLYTETVLVQARSSGLRVDDPAVTEGPRLALALVDAYLERPRRARVGASSRSGPAPVRGTIILPPCPGVRRAGRHRICDEAATHDTWFRTPAASQ